MNKAAAYYDDKAKRFRFEAGSVVNGQKVGGRFVTEKQADAVANAALVGFLNTPEPPKVAARKGQRRRRYSGKGKAGFATDWDGASKRRLYIA